MARKREPWDDAVAGASWAAELRPAPGNLRIIQALVNMAYPAARADELGDASSGSSIERTTLGGSWQTQSTPSPGSSPLE